MWGLSRPRTVSMAAPHPALRTRRGRLHRCHRRRLRHIRRQRRRWSRSGKANPLLEWERPTPGQPAPVRCRPSPRGLSTAPDRNPLRSPRAGPSSTPAGPSSDHQPASTARLHRHRRRQPDDAREPRCQRAARSRSKCLSRWFTCLGPRCRRSAKRIGFSSSSMIDDSNMKSEYLI